MPLFFINKESVADKALKISGDDAFHIARSLRMAVGDAVSVSDGEGTVYDCTLTKIRDDECECEILKSSQSKSESPVAITLFMAYPKGDKLELVIQKAVELGAVKIVPFESERCIKRPKADKAEKQTARLSRIAEEAAKQCGRGILPAVMPSVSFGEMLKQAKMSDLPLFCYEGTGTSSLKDILNSLDGVKSISVVVGCEGGFSPLEASAAQAVGLALTNLGPRILRCESAPIYALSAISFFFEL